MSTRVVDRVDEWEEQPFEGGYRGLRDLADRGFSGAVRAGGAELFMTKGTVVAVRRGAIEDFEDASGTSYAAPTPALPLLAVMQERSDEVRGKYYTEETPISEVDRTLEDGKFTGYVVLSENVLSGDYYLVYHQGRSMSVAFVGNSSRLVDGDEAFEQTEGEVGIYEVRPVAIEAIEIPEPEPEPEREPDPGPETESAGTAAAAAASGTVESGELTESTESAEPDGDAADGAEDSEAGATSDRAEATESPVETASDPAGEPDGDAGEVTSGMAHGGESEETPPEDAEAAGAEPAAETADAAETTDGRADEERADETTSNGGAGVDDARESTTRQAEPQPSPAESETGVSGGAGRGEIDDRDGETDDRSGGGLADADNGGAAEIGDTEARDGAERGVPDTGHQPSAGDKDPRPAQTEPTTGDVDPLAFETRAIPSLDPGRTSTHGTADGGPDAGQPATTARTPQTDGSRSASVGDESPNPAAGRDEPRPEEANAGDPEPAPADRTGGRDRDRERGRERGPETESADSEQVRGEGGDRTPDVDARVKELEAELDEREEAVERLEDELRDVREERSELQAELDRLQEERDELRGELERARERLSELDEPDAQRRLQPTEALAGTDLFLRYHTKGDATLEKAHSGDVHREDVRENLRLEKHTQFDADGAAVGGEAYGEFLDGRVEYTFVRWVVRELMFEIQNTGHTSELQDLYDAIPSINRVELNGSVAVEADGGEREETFDIVFRERMGDPLIVANINDSRQGASQSMMEQLITAAERVGRTTDQFAAAFLVTRSFFEPEALETVAEATRGGLLSRDKRASFVNLSRKRGYHLCLVEARNENFHLEVPEL